MAEEASLGGQTLHSRIDRMLASERAASLAPRQEGLFGVAAEPNRLYECHAHTFVLDDSSSPSEREPHVCFVVRTMPSQAPALDALLRGLRANDYTNMSVFVLQTEGPSERVTSVLDDLGDCRFREAPQQVTDTPYQSYGYFHTDRFAHACVHWHNVALAPYLHTLAQQCNTCTHWHTLGHTHTHS